MYWVTSKISFLKQPVHDQPTKSFKHRIVYYLFLRIRKVVNVMESYPHAKYCQWITVAKQQISPPMLLKKYASYEGTSYSQPLQSPSIKTSPTKVHPSYQVKFQMHRDSKILLNCPNCPSLERPRWRPSYKATFSFVEGVTF